MKIRKNLLQTVILTSVVLLAFLSGCDEEVVGVDITPPAVPTGVFSMTGDDVVTVFWNDTYYESIDDLVGYNIYRFCGAIPEDDPADGPYCKIGTINWDENFYDTENLVHWFDDFDVTNGATYYYAVSAFDAVGNESPLSFEFISDTPRPEGTAWIYEDEGFDFSSGSTVSGGSAAADIVVDFVNNIPFAHTTNGVLIQDYGIIDLQWVDVAPLDGYSNSGTCELIEGHSYIVWITEPEWHFAKFMIYQQNGNALDIDWAYQVDPNNPELSVPSCTDVDNNKVDVVRF